MALLKCSATFNLLNPTLRSTRSNTQQFYTVLTLRLCVLHASQIKQRLLPHTSLSDRFL
jgi:hypothetical protein